MNLCGCNNEKFGWDWKCDCFGKFGLVVLVLYFISALIFSIAGPFLSF